MKSSALPLLVGLVANCLLNLVLIPVWGLHGAVVSTTIATGLALVTLTMVNHSAGMKLDAGVLVFCLVPVAMCGGLWPSLFACAAMMLAMPWSRTLLSDAERRVFQDAAERYAEMVYDKFPSWRFLRRSEAGPRGEHGV
jgi:hypothetical protein